MITWKFTFGQRVTHKSGGTGKIIDRFMEGATQRYIVRFDEDGFDEDCAGYYLTAQS